MLRHIHPQSDCGLQMSPRQSRHNPDGRSECQALGLEHRKRARRKEQQRGNRYNLTAPPAAACWFPKGTECNLQ